LNQKDLLDVKLHKFVEFLIVAAKEYSYWGHVLQVLLHIGEKFSKRLFFDLFGAGLQTGMMKD